MDKKYLNKVLDQIVRETDIDYDEERLYTPFTPFNSLFFSPHYILPPFHFTNHCKNIYGLNEDEVKYVWKKYKEIIKEKLNNG